jgi:ABC-type Mn2+/Zn2+ transport system permease subunit
MQSAIPLVIVFCIGAGLGTLSQRFTKKLWLAAHLSATIGTITWVAGIYTLFWFTAPSELGPPKLVPTAFAYILMFIGATVAFEAAEARVAHKNPLGTAVSKKPADSD